MSVMEFVSFSFGDVNAASKLHLLHDRDRLPVGGLVHDARYEEFRFLDCTKTAMKEP
jgi:hypothetical protein